MNTIEETFVKTFLARNLRSRWLTRLASEKTRTKLTNKLAGGFFTDLDARFVYDKENPPPEIAVQVQSVLKKWKKANPKQLCHIIAANSERDGQTMSLEEAEADYLLTFGAIIIIIPDKLAYYHPERSNLNKQPFYILFHQ